MILVDSSAWIAFFRGHEPLAGRVDAALEHGEAALCGPVLCELRRAFVSKAERTRVLGLLASCHQLAEPRLVWEQAGDLGFALRRKGSTVKTLDLLIAVWALNARVPILTSDGDFAMMKRAGVPLVLA